MISRFPSTERNSLYQASTKKKPCGLYSINLNSVSTTTKVNLITAKGHVVVF